MKYLDKYPNCIGCPVKKWCGTMISSIRLCNSYQDNKEETKMDYKKRYNQAIEAAKRELHCCGSLDCDAARQIFRLFPELRDSEDERIRKEIIQSIQDNMCVIHKDKCIAWLEKQGEQKPVWSEEDEKILNSIIEEIRPFGECPDYPTDEDREYYYGRTKMIAWLKSLKPQNRWKPSEEQMKGM